MTSCYRAFGLQGFQARRNGSEDLQGLEGLWGWSLDGQGECGSCYADLADLLRPGLGVVTGRLEAASGLVG